MSLDSWKKEFYPVEANKVSEENALAHSLQKWDGLRPKNLDRHSVTVYRAVLQDEDGYRLTIADGSCALCHQYMYEDMDPFSGGVCMACPLYKIRGIPCDVSAGGSEFYETSPYDVFRTKNDPEPMINLIKKAMEVVK